VQSDMVQQQRPDGTWGPATPIPLMRCVTPWWRRVVLALKYGHGSDEYEAALTWEPEEATPHA